MSITPKSRILKSDQAYQCILKWIRDGVLAPGERLPAEQTLAKQINVNHRTVRKALDRLVQENLVYKRPQVGSFVQEPQKIEAPPRVALILPAYLLKITAPGSTDSEPRAGHPAIGAVVSGVCSVFNQQHYDITPMFYQDHQLWRDVGPLLAARQIKNVILQANTATHQGVQQLLDAGINVVLVGYCPAHLSGMGLTRVDVDRGGAAAEALRRMVNLGHRDITIALYDEDIVVRRALDDLTAATIGSSMGKIRLSMLDIPNDGGKIDFTPLKEVFNRCSRPTAAILSDEFMAVKLTALCEEQGVCIPSDLSIAALSNFSSNVVPLSAPDSFHLAFEAARCASQYLMKAINGQPARGQSLLIDSPISWTRSIAPGRFKNIPAPEASVGVENNVPVTGSIA